MKQESKQLSLTLEELALTLSLFGQPELAKSILANQLGTISADEERGRLLAASHSLMAKDVLSLHNTKMKLTPDFVQLLSPLVVNDFMLRCSYKIKTENEHVLNCYFKENSIVVQYILLGVIHKFYMRDTETAFVEDCLAFLKMQDLEQFEAPTISIPENQFEKARRLAQETLSKVTEYLETINIDENTQKLLAEDLHQPVYRAAVLRIDSDQTVGLQSEKGFLLLMGLSGRVWQMSINGKGLDQEEAGTSLTISPATVQNLNAALYTLIESK